MRRPTLLAALLAALALAPSARAARVEVTASAGPAAEEYIRFTAARRAQPRQGAQEGTPAVHVTAHLTRRDPTPAAPPLRADFGWQEAF